MFLTLVLQVFTLAECANLIDAFSACFHLLQRFLLTIILLYHPAHLSDIFEPVHSSIGVMEQT